MPVLMLERGNGVGGYWVEYELEIFESGTGGGALSYQEGDGGSSESGWSWDTVEEYCLCVL